jgi:VWFA-related protein
MNVTNHSLTGILLRTLGLIEFSTFVLMSMSNSQENGASENAFLIRVGVEEVRLDAVVLNKKGLQITDLGAGDFEIIQDGSPQKITSSVYINQHDPQPKNQPDISHPSKATLPISTPALTRNAVQRTFVFVADNLSMDQFKILDLKMALRKFVENQMQPGDLVAIVPTAFGNASFQVFTSDKKHLLSMIHNIKWHVPPGTPQMPAFMAISFCIKALQDMPGRKFLILISKHVKGPVEMEEAFNPLADAALRAGVVVHTLDIAGLGGIDLFGNFGASVGMNCTPADINSGACFAARNVSIAARAAEKNSLIPIPLSKKTGGLFLENSNFFVTKNGIGRVSEEIKGYYLLTYIPPVQTFKQGLPRAYHKIQVKVKRPGAEVHSRDGFFGISQTVDKTAENPGSLQEAISSPFRINNLNVNLYSGYTHDSQKGYLLQSWMHLDAKDVSIVETKEGMNTVSMEAACLTSDIENVIQNSSSQRYQYFIKKEDLPRIKKQGFEFSIVTPIKEPGSYYVRAAVKDQQSGKIGSAYQFIEIPDLSNKRLALSNIFMINRDGGLPWTQIQMPEASKNRLYPIIGRDRKGLALRTFSPGDTIEYAVVLYNTDKLKKDLEFQVMLLGNGKIAFQAKPEDVDLGGVSDLAGVLIRKKFVLENSLQPGDYILLLQVSPKGVKNRVRVIQTLDFTVLSK